MTDRIACAALRSRITDADTEDDAALDLATAHLVEHLVDLGERRGGDGCLDLAVTAVSEKAFAQAVGMMARGGTVALNGLPPGDFPLNIFGPRA
jgi:D-arabinose 1-dehydrogenase-like Zn-dependent alcohol dehydrogenase